MSLLVYLQPTGTLHDFPGIVWTHLICVALRVSIFCSTSCQLFILGAVHLSPYCLIRLSDDRNSNGSYCNVCIDPSYQSSTIHHQDGRATGRHRQDHPGATDTSSRRVLSGREAEGRKVQWESNEGGAQRRCSEHAPPDGARTREAHVPRRYEARVARRATAQEVRARLGRIEALVVRCVNHR